MIRRIYRGGLWFRVHRSGADLHTKTLATCFFCGKDITRKGDLERVPVLSEGSEVKVPSCHSCFLTVKKLRGFLWVRVKVRVSAPTSHTFSLVNYFFAEDLSSPL